MIILCIALIIICVLLAIGAAVVSLAYFDAEREVLHMYRYSVRRPGVKYIKKSWLRMKLKKLLHI